MEVLDQAHTAKSSSLVINTDFEFGPGDEGKS
jgi:hypothetical protein